MGTLHLRKKFLCMKICMKKRGSLCRKERTETALQCGEVKFYEDESFLERLTVNQVPL